MLQGTGASASVRSEIDYGAGKRIVTESAFEIDSTKSPATPQRHEVRRRPSMTSRGCATPVASHRGRPGTPGSRATPADARPVLPRAGRPCDNAADATDPS